ncbi:hypothetical protein [Sulfurimonas sp.]|uniref:hypothetical protein n=1 Tax=Sulfurimonas sp. TaxID=2022749 RepID=UPI002AAFF258|nr:hypothetical protein [Sulfurimonas sp.]
MFCDGLYEIVSKTADEAVVKLSDKKHPIFKAHFPIKPILPGFIHFEIIADVFDMEITNIKKTKFTKMVKPSQTLVYKRDNNKFKVFCDNEEVVSIIL